MLKALFLIRFFVASKNSKERFFKNAYLKKLLRIGATQDSYMNFKSHKQLHKQISKFRTIEDI